MERAEESATSIVAKDCSPIPISSREDDDWLRKLVATAKADDMLLHLGHKSDEPDDEPIAFFEAASGIWWAGRYVGEVQFEGRTLGLNPGSECQA